jgi:hypothetical protein
MPLAFVVADVEFSIVIVLVIKVLVIPGPCLIPMRFDPTIHKQMTKS